MGNTPTRRSGAARWVDISRSLLLCGARSAPLGCADRERRPGGVRFEATWRHDGGVKRSTAIGHLLEMAEVASERLTLRDSAIGWPLEELWVGGDLLGLADSMEVGSVVLVLDLPAGELVWLARNPAAEWVGEQLRLGKRPMQWSYRPLAWPVWNHQHRRVVRFWSADAGLDPTVIEALRSGRLDRLPVVQPSATELTDQLRHELALSRRHLRAVLDGYWDRDWRREHNRFGGSPEDHLWRAAMAVTEIHEALNELQP